MRRLGLDIGEVRVGVALSDPTGRVATPLKVLDARSLAADPSPLRVLVEDYDVEELVVGLPVGLSGEEGRQAANVRHLAEKLSAAVGLPVTYQDERLTSAQARRSMREAGVTEKDGRGAVDMVAAAILLQAYLDARGTPAGDGGSQE